MTPTLRLTAPAATRAPRHVLSAVTHDETKAGTMKKNLRKTDRVTRERNGMPRQDLAAAAAPS
jgi:hypothetical protein